MKCIICGSDSAPGYSAWCMPIANMNWVNITFVTCTPCERDLAEQHDAEEFTLNMIPTDKQYEANLYFIDNVA